MSTDHSNALNPLRLSDQNSLIEFYDQLNCSPELYELVRSLINCLKVRLHLPEPLRIFTVLIGAASCSKVTMNFLINEASPKLPHEMYIDLLEGRKPADMSEDQKLIYCFCTEILKNGRVSTATFEPAAARFGPSICLEIVMVLGSIAALSMLNDVI